MLLDLLPQLYLIKIYNMNALHKIIYNVMYLIMYNILYPLTKIYPIDCYSSLNKSCRTKGIRSDYLVDGNIQPPSKTLNIHL